jgi:hypothetical protein
MILLRILPGVLKELSKHVPTVLFQTVEWSELAAEIPKLSRRIVQKEGYDDLYQTHRELLDPYDIQLTNQALTPSQFADPKSCGTRLLTLYFVQLFSRDGIFLDLRPQHFEEESSILKWHPTGLWTQLDEGFRQGLLKVYEGFYLENDDLYYQGLEEIGLLSPSFGKDDKQQLGDLFRAQFGGALDMEMRFDLEHLKNSIVGLSNFMLQKKVTISKDFLYLGIYLVTLYATLEKLGESYPVKEIYLGVRGRFSA